MSSNMRSKETHEIGYCAVADISGFPIEYLNRIKKEGSDALREIGYDLVEYPRLLCNHKTANEFLHQLSTRKVSIVIFNFAGWIEAGVLSKLIRNSKSAFFILWAFGNYNETLTLTGLLENTSMLSNLNCTNYCTIIGPPDDKEVRKKIETRLKVHAL